MKKNISILLFFASLWANIALAQNSIIPDDFEKALKENPANQLLDVRTKTEFEKGHLKNALNYDWNDAEEFRKQTATLDKSKPLYVYCYSGGRSGQAMNFLVKEGFTVTNLKGGVMKWTEANKAFITPPNPALAENSRAYTKAEFEGILNSNEAVLIDVFAPWCGPCLKMKPIMDKLKEELKGQVLVLTIDSDQNKFITQDFNIDEIPTFLFFNKTKLKNRAVGYMTEATMRMLIKDSF